MTEQEQVEGFISELAKVERKLALHTLTLVRDEADAEDILQQAKLVMWRSFSKFNPGTNFGAWARKIILNQVLNYRQKQKRSRLWFTDDILELVAEEMEEADGVLQRQQAALQDCVKKLPPDQQVILQQRYFANRSIEEIAKAAGRTEGAVYRLLSRIRKSLHDCISRSLEKEASHHAWT